jgi:hypothetical protein
VQFLRCAPANFSYREYGRRQVISPRDKCYPRIDKAFELERNIGLHSLKSSPCQKKAQAPDRFRIPDIKGTNRSPAQRQASPARRTPETKRAEARAWAELALVRGLDRAAVFPDLVPARGLGRHLVRPPSAHVHVLS